MSATILVLEDDESLRETLADSLEDHGYTVHQAGGSDAALSLGRKHAFDLVVTDVRMADVDGLETLGLLREIHPVLKSIVITGFADESAPPRAIRACALDYLYKPFTLKELLAAVRRVLGAEQERQGYHRLLGALVDGYRTMLTAVADGQLRTIESDRNHAFRAFYVALRSRLLAEAEAVDVWSRLLVVEHQRDRLRKSGLDLAECKRLGDGYRQVCRQLGALARLEPEPAPAAPLDRQRFQPLFQGLEQGRVSLEQLKLAPLLNALRHPSMRLEPELEELVDLLWGGNAA